MREWRGHLEALLGPLIRVTNLQQTAQVADDQGQCRASGEQKTGGATAGAGGRNAVTATRARMRRGHGLTVGRSEADARGRSGRAEERYTALSSVWCCSSTTAVRLSFTL